MRQGLAGAALLFLVLLATGMGTREIAESSGPEAAALLREADELLAASTASGRCLDQPLAKLLLRCQSSPEPAVSDLVAALRKQQLEQAKRALEASSEADRHAALCRASALAELLCHLGRVRQETLRGSTGPAEVGGFTFCQRLTVRTEGDQFVFSKADSAGANQGEQQSFWKPAAWAETSVSALPLSSFEFAMPAKASTPIRGLTRCKVSWDAKQPMAAEMVGDGSLNQLSEPQQPSEFLVRSNLHFVGAAPGNRPALGFLRGKGAWSRGEGRAVLAVEVLTLLPAGAGKETPGEPACFVPTYLAYKHAGQNLRVVDSFPGVPEAVPAVALVRYADGTYAGSEEEDPAVGAGVYISLLTVKQRLPDRRFVFDDGGLSILDRTGTKTLLFARLVEGALDAGQGELRYELQVVRSMKEQSRWIRDLLACPRIRVQLSQGGPLFDFLAATKDLSASATAPALGVARVSGCK